MNKKTIINRQDKITIPFNIWAEQQCFSISDYCEENNCIIVVEKPYTYIYHKGKVGVSKCCETDVFDKRIGLVVAFYNLKKWQLPVEIAVTLDELNVGDKFTLPTRISPVYVKDCNSQLYKHLVICLKVDDCTPEAMNKNRRVIKVK